MNLFRGTVPTAGPRPPTPRPPTGDDDEMFLNYARSPRRSGLRHLQQRHHLAAHPDVLEQARALTRLGGQDDQIYDYDQTTFATLGMVPAGMNAPGHDPWEASVIAEPLLDGHTLLGDWMFLIAAIVFAVATVATYLRQAVPRDAVPCFIPLGLTLVAVGLLVV